MSARPFSFYGRGASPYRKNKRRSGMVLFEVIIAITVFTVAAFALVMALNRCLDGANVRNKMDIVVRGLENQMSLLHGSNITAGETDAPDDGTGIAYHVSVALSQTLRDQKGLPVPNEYSVTITASWKTPEGDLETKSVSQLVYQP